MQKATKATAFKIPPTRANLKKGLMINGICTFEPDLGLLKREIVCSTGL